MTRSI